MNITDKEGKEDIENKICSSLNLGNEYCMRNLDIIETINKIFNNSILNGRLNGRLNAIKAEFIYELLKKKEEIVNFFSKQRNMFTELKWKYSKFFTDKEIPLLFKQEIDNRLCVYENINNVYKTYPIWTRIEYLEKILKQKNMLEKHLKKMLEEREKKKSRRKECLMRSNPKHIAKRIRREEKLNNRKLLPIV